MNFYEAVEKRRSYYEISNEAVISDKQIEGIIEHAVKHAPSAFNSQSGRVLLLLKEHHHALWDIVLEALKKIVPEKKFAKTAEKIKSFDAGYGTALFFEDQSVIEALQKEFTLYKDNFPVWSQQSSGMLQFIVWTALEIEGFGASLQHYNELIEQDVRRKWNIPESWRLISQLPFGKPVSEPYEKEFEPIDERVKVYS